MFGITLGLLHNGHDVKVICLSTPKHPFDPDTVPLELQERTKMEGIYVDTSLNIVDAFTDLVTADNYNISRFFSPDMDIRLIRLLSREKFDVILLESLFMTPYIATIRRYSKGRVVLRSHNLEHMIQERIAHGETNFFKKPYRRFLAKQLKQYEVAVLKRVDGVAAITPGDAEHLMSYGGKTPVVTIPFGIDPDAYATRDPAGVPIFFHLGSMDWLPNEEGVRWLVTKVWPLVTKAHPTALLHLAGNKMPQDLLDLKVAGLTVNGRVENADEYMSARHVMVVPLFSAGGMRVKIIEGMAMGKCVISTTMGAEGIACKHGRDILLTDSPEEMAKLIGSIIDDPTIATRIGEHARELVLAHYAIDAIVRDLIAFLESLGKA
jgi:glycosyltransferase involved in cell wall biosynthesis